MPDPIVAPPSPTPAPAPPLSAPASPPPPERPAVPPELGQSFDSTFPDDGLDTPPEPKPKPAPEKPKGKVPAKEPPKEPAKEPPKEPAKEPEEGEKEEAESASEFSPPQVAKPNELRSWANRMGSRAQKAETKLSKMEARIAQLEKQPPKQAEDVSNLAQELAAAKQKLEKYETDIRLTNYERSQEYAEKYQKPYQDAIASAYRDVKELLVTTVDPRDPENTSEREGTIEDFNEVYALPLGQATRLAKAKFGDAASIVLGHRAKIRALADSAYTAVEDYKKRGGEVETQTKAQMAQREQAMQRMFTTVVEGHSKKAPEVFLERDGDDEGNELLAKGRQAAMSVFRGNEGLSPQDIAKRDGIAYNRLAAYPRLMRDLRVARAELEEAKATIEELRGSGPGSPKPAPAKPQDQGDYVPIDQAFDSSVKG